MFEITKSLHTRMQFGQNWCSLASNEEELTLLKVTRVPPFRMGGKKMDKDVSLLIHQPLSLKQIINVEEIFK